jgi:hypothetical protein
MKTTTLFALFFLINFFTFLFNLIIIALLAQTASHAEQCMQLCNRTAPTDPTVAVFTLNTSNGTESVYIEGSEMITLKFRPIDIYRLDPSCDVVRATTGKSDKALGEKYAMKRVNCGLLPDHLNMAKSRHKLIAKKRGNQSRTLYEPVFNIDRKFNPFKYDRQLYPTLFSNLHFSNQGGYHNPFAGVPRMRGMCDDTMHDYLAFIVTYSEERFENLQLFLVNIHRFLQFQEWPFRYIVIVAEQTNVDAKTPFNKGRLINSAVRYVMDNLNDKIIKISCFVLHDLDLIPADDSGQLREMGDYTCRLMPVLI